MKHLLKTGLVILSFTLAIGSIQAQKKEQTPWGIHAISASVANMQYGLPFLRITPFHPGGELGLTFFRSSNGQHRLNGNLGYFYHNLLAHVPYLNASYQFQYSIANTIGLDATAGAGYAHLIHPRKGYEFDPSTKTFVSKTDHAPYFTAHLGIGASLLISPQFQPFIRYTSTMVGSPDAMIASFSIGTTFFL